MQRFAIYHKSESFHPTTNQVFYTFNGVLLSIWIFVEEIVKTEQFRPLFGWAAATSWLAALIAVLIGNFKPPPLRGKLEGFISFYNDKITVGNEVFNLNEIKRIKITNDDYYGKLKHMGRGNFNARYSNGVDNELLIELNSSKASLYNFEMYNPDDFQKIRPELINLHLQGKLEFGILINILGLEKDDEINDFRNSLQNTAVGLEPQPY